MPGRPGERIGVRPVIVVLQPFGRPIPHLHTLGVLLRPIESAQYAALSFGEKLEAARIAPSMDRVGSALDNAISENFVSTLKCEIGVSRYSTRRAARTSVFEFIEFFYNRERRHSSLGYRSPSEYEQAILEEVAVA